jgi:Aerotolerance regulator N-terminal/von Willebrand factor type A domain
VNFLTPWFLIGVSALAIPVLIHLIQRERKRVVVFPSLMFLRRIPYQSVRRRSIRHWFLLLLRAAAILLIVAAFARPFIPEGALAVAASGGAREIVVLLDQSASMGYGDHFQRAREAARKAIDGLGGEDKATLVLFAKNAEENVRATGDRLRLGQAVDAAKVTSGSTRYGPALKLAQSILSASSLKRKEVVLVSDFQKTGWSGAEELRFPDGTVFTPVSVASPETSNVSIPSVAFARASFSGQERITVTAGLVNHGNAPVNGLTTVLEVDGQTIESKPVTIAANSSASVSFAAFTLSAAYLRGTVRAGTDPLPQDNVFHFVLTPSRPVSVLVVAPREESGQRTDPTLYLSKALSIGTTPAFQTEVVSAARMTPANLDKRAVVILNDTPFPPAAAGGGLKKFVEQGGGLLVVLGEHSSWPQNDAALLPGTLGGIVDRPDGRGGALGFLDYSHSVFEVFKAPRSGDFSGTRVFRYRALTAPPAGRVLARFDDGAVAATEQRTGLGRVIAWNTTLDDSWSDLAKKPVFLPLVHQLTRYLARYEEPAAWRTVGQALDLTSGSILVGGRRDRVALTPSGRRLTLSTGNGPEFLELDEQGFYELRSTGAAETRPPAVAVDIDPPESDLSAMDPAEFTAALTGRAAPEAAKAAASEPATPQDLERRQAIWWYLLFGGILLLATETILSNRISRVIT